MSEIIVEQLFPGNHPPGEWKRIGTASSFDEAVQIAQREDDPEGFGSFRHPSGGPRYGSIRALFDGKTYVWDRNLNMFIQT